MTHNAPVIISQSEIDSIQKLYTFKEPTEVVQFLEKYPFIVPPLLEAPTKLRKYFPNEPIFLEVVPDPEIVNYVQLILSILITLDSPEALFRLNKFDEDWLLGQSYEVREQICTLVEYPDEF